MADKHKRIVQVGYDAIGERYLAGRDQSEHAPDVLLLGELIARLEPGAQVLDAGCGPGVPVTSTLSRQYRAVGLDISLAQLRLARATVHKAQFIQGDMAHLAFADSVFDAVCSHYAIIHVPREEHPMVFGEFWRVSRPGGYLFISVGMEDVQALVKTDWFGAEAMHWSFHDTDTSVQLIQDSGFEVLRRSIVEEVLDGTVRQHPFVLAQKTSRK